MAPRINGREAGVLIHKVIGTLLEEGHTTPSLADILGAVVPLVRDSVGPYRQAAKLLLLSGTGVYFRRFLPPPPWRLDGVEVSIPHGRLDLLFRHPEDLLFADEVKTGRVNSAPERVALEEQLERAASGASERFGEAFIGIRAVVLGAPRTSSLVQVGETPLPIWDWADHAA